MKEKVEKTRKEREEKVKADDETVERARVWDEANAKEKAEIPRIASEARN